MHHAVTHIHGEQEIKKLILSLPRYWWSFWHHFMWHSKGYKMAWSCIETSDGLGTWWVADIQRSFNGKQENLY
jgi:hypothetical protein